MLRALFGSIRISLGLPVLFVLGMTGCGYTFQGTQNPLLNLYGIRKVYISPLVNDTFKPGVENLVYNELLRVISANQRVRVVSLTEDADAVLDGNVTAAAYTVNAGTQSGSLYPQTAEIRKRIQAPPDGIPVAGEYSATLNCSFKLTLRHDRQGSPVNQILWSSPFSRSKVFPSNTQLGPFGTTSGLINDSEFDRALRDLARVMMQDVHENMLAMF